MKPFLTCLILCALASAQVPTTPPLIASNFGHWSVPAGSVVSSPGTSSVTLQFSSVTADSGPAFPAVSANTPLLIVDPGSNEVVVPTIVNCSMGGIQCSFAAVFTKAHKGNFTVSSGSFGLQEAINYLIGNSGGTVQVTSDWPGTTATITAARGATNVSIQDIRNGLTVYTWTGSAYAATQSAAGTQASPWTAAMACGRGTSVTANPDNLHVFKAINSVSGSAGGTQPSWNTQPGSLTVDGSCSWMEYGSSGASGSTITSIPPSSTVASLPASNTPGQIVAVTDGNTPSDCVVGGGLNTVVCFWNGIAWGQLGNTISFPWSLGQGGTGSTTPCSTVNAVAVFGASSLGCGSTLLWDGTVLTVGSPGTGYIGIPHGASNPCIGNLSNSYYCIWMNDATSTLQCYILNGGTSCMPAGSVAGTAGNVVNIGGGNIPADAGFLSSNIVRKDAVNTGGAAMTLDLHAALGFTIPTFAGATATSDGFFAYNTTSKNLHIGANLGVDNIVAIFPASTTITDGDLAVWSNVGGVKTLTDGGAPGGGGGGGGGTSQLFTTVNGGDAGCSGNVCTGTAADQVIYTFSVANPGNGKCVDVFGSWRTTTSSNGGKVLKVKFAGTAWAWPSYNANVNSESEFSLQICNNQSSHTAQTAVQTQPIFGGVTALSMSGPNTAAVDWSAGAQTIQIIQNVAATEHLTWDEGQVVTLP